MSCFCCCDFRGGITCNLVGNIALNIKKHVAVVATLNAILAHAITHSYSCTFARDMTRKITGGTTCNLASNMVHYITVVSRTSLHAILCITLQGEVAQRHLAHAITSNINCNLAPDIASSITSNITCNLARKIAYNFTSRNICKLAGNIPRNILPTSVTGNMAGNLVRSLSILHEILRVQLQLLSVATSLAILRVTFF